MSERSAVTQSALTQLMPLLYDGSQAKFRLDWEKWRSSKENTTIFTPNPEQIVQAQQNPAFLTVMLSADILLADGVGLVWAAKKLLKNDKKIVRFSGRHILQWWLKEAQQRQISTLLLGSAEGVAEALAREYDPKQQWCWATNGYQDITSPSVEERDAIFSLIIKSKPQVVFVAFGAPWQEMWVSENRQKLAELGVKITMVCGGAIDTLSPATAIVQPPKIIEKLQIEWLFRLWQQPWRWRRQLRLIEFIKLVFMQSSD